MTALPRAVLAAAKINLALVVGPPRPDGLHELATVMQRIGLADELELTAAPAFEVTGFAEDTIVRRALELLAAEIGGEPRWRVHVRKRIPVAAGLGGGSADAAAALSLANATLPVPLEPGRLHRLASRVGADVPFFLEPGPKLAQGAGERLRPVSLPQDFWLVVAIAEGAVKRSTGEVYRRFDELGGAAGFAERRAELLAELSSCRRSEDLARLPPNDLAAAAGGSPLLTDLRAAGALRADLSGAGPACYGLFRNSREAEQAAATLPPGGRSWVVQPVW